MPKQLTLPLFDVVLEPVASHLESADSFNSRSTQRASKDAAPAVLTAFIRVFRRMNLGRPLPEFRVDFRPYAGLRSTIKLHDTQLHVSMSDLLADAPPLVLEALGEILLGKLFRRRVSREARECYLAHVFKESTRQRIEQARRQRGYKRQRPARGRSFDLAEIFAQLNNQFFEGRLARPRLGWSPKRSRTVLGHYDSAHDSITISRWLDSPSVPRCLVEYIVFHEMLHIQHPVQRNGHRRIVHPREFQNAEKKFPQYEQVRRFLKRMGRGSLNQLE